MKVRNIKKQYRWKDLILVSKKCKDAPGWYELVYCGQGLVRK